MTMIPFNGDIMQALKWQQNKAPGIISILQKKKAWYDQYHKQFWTDWEHNVFDLRTANPFGLMVWCIILGVPAGGFGLYPAAFAWAYGPERQNFVYSGADPALPDKNLIGGNFYGGGSAEILDLDEIRRTLQLRYVALVNNGSVAYINWMLRYIFNDGEPWDFPNGRYFYLADLTLDAAQVVVDGIYRTDWQGRNLAYQTARTNKARWAQQPTQSVWTMTNMSGTANNAAAPDGSMTATLLTENAFTASNASLVQAVTITPGSPIWISMFFKMAADMPIVGFYFDGVDERVAFNIQTGAVVTSPLPNTQAEIHDMGNGWYRCAIGFIPFGPDPTSDIHIETYASDGTLIHDGSNSRSFYAWGADFKQDGPSAPLTPYIQTSVGTVTVTDVTVNGTACTFRPAPVNGAILEWIGTWGGIPTGGTAAAGGEQFGTGNGMQTVFNLTPPPGAPTAAPNVFNMEYRVGPAMGISAQLINLYNDPEMGIMPSSAGSKVTVIQE